MKFSSQIIIVLALLFSFGPTANAQNLPDREIGDIIGDIFKGSKGGQEQFPNQSMIDNIPVNVRFDAGPNGLPEHASLVISAFAPPAPNVRRSSPLMIGETRILLTGLNSPLELVIAAPASITQEIDYARIEAIIVDADGKIIFKSNDSGEYRGRDIPVLTLEHVEGYAAAPTPTTTPTPTKEKVNGVITLGGDNPEFRGSKLVVQLLEDGLAGGNGQLILGTYKQSIDQKTAPFKFSFEKTEDTDKQTPLIFDAWIEDWAGRKTHTLPLPMQYNGTEISYRLKLHPSNIAPILSPRSQGGVIKGEARFNAFKGLPAGAVLIAELEQNKAGSRPIKLARNNVKLDGLSGNIPFGLDMLDQRLDPATANAVIRVRIEDKNGKLFFLNPGGTPLVEGFNAVQLQASPNY